MNFFCEKVIQKNEETILNWREMQMRENKNNNKNKGKKGIRRETLKVKKKEKKGII